jgi:hypothetical protein
MDPPGLPKLPQSKTCVTSSTKAFGFVSEAKQIFPTSKKLLLSMSGLCLRICVENQLSSSAAAPSTSTMES